ncbi:NAD-dependent epimerase/dehydratase family protein [Paraburkholderia sp. UYCP14C]|uniref:NmrA family NAD(P)-binding protein n=1 Tax=Paraburkholderia sp. UYCP14C TaxID=2511130 RepID=UPI00101F6120|nr:NmrA family NAD(P)-binding protein [Paraburkholderia sp. UYCP14C]RZF27305.1 NAD-dependent epimerase/dehydratase family protein [Paraburkholderia sp. UYCP14C]
MQQRKYLITGATGKTGAHTIRHLLNDGHAVRAFVHQEDERSAALRAQGAEVVVGDLLEHDDVLQAMDGVTGAYLCYPVRPGFIEATAYFADAARRAGVEVLVEMSQISAREDSKSHAARNHWIAERVLDWSGVPSVHIRPTFFSEWLIFPWVLDTIVNEGRITLPYGNGRHAPIAAEDQARFIATVLTNPAGHIGKTYDLCGPIELDHHGIADEIGKVLDRKIAYRPATLDEYRKHLHKYGLPEFMIQHFIEVAIDYQNGVFAGKDGIIEQVTGQAPQTVEAFVRANRQLFEG